MVGPIALLALAGIAFFVWYRRNQRKKANVQATPPPTYNYPPGPQQVWEKSGQPVVEANGAAISQLHSDSMPVELPANMSPYCGHGNNGHEWTSAPGV